MQKKIYFNSGVDEAIWCIIIACYIIYKTDEIELQAPTTEIFSLLATTNILFN